MRRALALALAATAGACTADEEARPLVSARADQCFNARFVSSFTPAGRDAVDVRVGPNQVYRLDLGPGCLDVDWARAVALRSRTGSFICGPADAELVVPALGARRPDRCNVQDVRRLSEAEIDASRRRRRD